MEEQKIILENENRKMIYNHITAHPGVSFVVLRGVFGFNESTLRYHLNYLEKNQKITFGLESGSRLYYPKPDNGHAIYTSEISGSNGTYKLSTIQEQILTVIKRYPLINQKELTKRSGINRVTLGKNLNKLMAQCVIRKIPNGNEVNYEYIENEKLRFEILKRLLVKLLNNEINEQTFLDLKRKLD